MVSIRYAVRYAVGRQLACSKLKPAGSGMRLSAGTRTRSAKVPEYLSLSSERLGSSVSSPWTGEPITACTTTDEPSGPIPAASVPRIIGTCSSRRACPLRAHTS